MLLGLKMQVLCKRGIILSVCARRWKWPWQLVLENFSGFTLSPQHSSLSPHGWFMFFLTLSQRFSFLLPPTSYPARTALLVTVFLCQVKDKLTKLRRQANQVKIKTENKYFFGLVNQGACNQQLRIFTLANFWQAPSCEIVKKMTSTTFNLKVVDVIFLN